jgi:hypothetical protein
MNVMLYDRGNVALEESDTGALTRERFVAGGDADDW